MVNILYAHERSEGEQTNRRLARALLTSLGVVFIGALVQHIYSGVLKFTCMLISPRVTDLISVGGLYL